MKFTLNHFIYMAIILLSIFLIFPKIIEGNTCSKREYIDDFTTCSDGMPNTLSYSAYLIKCIRFFAMIIIDHIIISIN